jgi:hypothetical protein
MIRLLVFSLSALALIACGEERLISQPPDPPLQDRFPQKRASSIDILFVIDNSESMAHEQASLSANFGNFLRYVDPDPLRGGERDEVDYRLAITTTDASRTGGALVGTPAILRPGAGYDPLEKFQQNALVGIKGGSLEAGFDAALAALENASKLNGGKDFLRPEAWLYIIFLSDEDDGSFGEVHHFYRVLESMKGTGNENAVAISAIVMPRADACAEGREVGTRYIQLAELSGGVVGDLCAEDWSDTLRQLAVSGIGLAKRFQLDRPPLDQNADGVIDFEDLEVRVRYPCAVGADSEYLANPPCGRVTVDCEGRDEDHMGVLCEPYHDANVGWVFNPVQNTVVFGEGAVPGPGAEVDVTYFPRTK